MSTIGIDMTAIHIQTSLNQGTLNNLVKLRLEPCNFTSLFIAAGFSESNHMQLLTPTFDITYSFVLPTSSKCRIICYHVATRLTSAAFSTLG